MLGVPPLSEKGAVSQHVHTWIGVEFQAQGRTAIMTVTPQLHETLATSLEPLLTGKGHISLTDARRAVGQAQRLAQIVPEAQPWAAALWAALTAAMHQSTLPRREAPPGRLPVSQFTPAAKWFSTLLHGAILPLRRVVTPSPAERRIAGPLTIAFDACPWGWGATCAYEGVITAWAAGTWGPHILKRFGAQLGSCRWQPLWEFVACLSAFIFGPPPALRSQF